MFSEFARGGQSNKKDRSEQAGWLRLKLNHPADRSGRRAPERDCTRELIIGRSRERQWSRKKKKKKPRSPVPIPMAIGRLFAEP